MKNFVIPLLVVLMSANSANAQPDTEPVGVRNLLKIVGPVAQFEFDNSSTYIWSPDNIKLPPIMIYAHGGGGYRNSDQVRVSIFRDEGFATISFDAYEANDFYDWKWVNRRLSNKSKQKMIFSILSGAYRYALKRKDWDTKNVFLFGQSNGGRVVVAAQSALKPVDNIRGIIAEGMATGGMQLSKCIIPTFLAYGERDNWGSFRVDRTMYARPQQFITGLPNSTVLPSIQRWTKTQNKEGCPINLKLYKEAGHSFHSGNLETYSGRSDIEWYIGAEDSALEKYENDITDFIEKHLMK